MSLLYRYQLRSSIAVRAILDRALAKIGLYLIGIRWHPRGTAAKLYQAILTSHQGTTRPVIFDVGANIGQTTLAFRHSIPDADIHAFEMIPSTFALLAENTRGLRHITINPFGMSDREEQRTIRLNNDPLCNSVRATVGDENAPCNGHTTTAVRLRTLDSYCSERAIANIDILKSDTEGHELAVIAGAQRLLNENRIQTILMECTLDGMSNDHVPLADLTDRLSPHGFILFGIYDLGYERNGRLTYLNALFVRPTTVSPAAASLNRNAIPK